MSRLLVLLQLVWLWSPLPRLLACLLEKKNKLREKYKDRGTAGAKQYRKESSEAEKKSQKKYNVDRRMVEKYGKDAYKSRAFGVSPEEPKRKTKPKTTNHNTRLLGLTNRNPSLENAIQSSIVEACPLTHQYYRDISTFRQTR